jgi:iron-sulfur cluster repair protein YtfE (RIC family)
LKQEHCDSIFKTISELNDSIDLEFDNCAGAIMQRFDNVKSAIKQSIESDVQAIQAKQDEINEEIEQEALKINQMIERPLHELSEDQILQLTSLYHDFASIQAKHQGSIDLLRQERDHIKLKKQKHLRKLNQVVNALLREFGDKASPQKDTDNEAVRCATPEKRRGITNSQNSATKSPPNIVEMVRSGRRNFVQ